MKKTKIVSTIGPASEQKDILHSLVKNGMNVMRLNLSHGGHEEQKFRIDNVKQLNSELGETVGILLDTKGPEIRTGLLENGAPVDLKAGEQIRITTDYSFIGNKDKIAVSYPGLFDDVEIGGYILCEDGNISLTVIDKDQENKELICRINNDRKLGQKRNVDVPGEVLNMEFISPKDYDDIVFACKEDLDFIAASFTRRAQDVLDIKKILAEQGNDHIKIIAKIENQEGLDNLSEIIDVADGVMVARGDLGVNVDLWELPVYQNEIINMALEKGKPCIVATQMLDSMTSNPRPTRAEVMDVYNATVDGTAATMLSGETTVGYYPSETVRMMRKIQEVAEDFIDYDNARSLAIKGIDTSNDSVKRVINAVNKSMDPSTSVIVAEGDYEFARLISSLRPFVNVFFAVPTNKDARLLSILWGIDPVVGTLEDALKSANNRFGNRTGSKILALTKDNLKEIII